MYGGEILTVQDLAYIKYLFVARYMSAIDKDSCKQKFEHHLSRLEHISATSVDVARLLCVESVQTDPK